MKIITCEAFINETASGILKEHLFHISIVKKRKFSSFIAQHELRFPHYDVCNVSI